MIGHFKSMDLSSQILDMGPDPWFGSSNPGFGSPIFEIISKSLDLDLQILDLGSNPGSGPPAFRNDFKKHGFGRPNQGFEVPNHTIWYGMVWYGVVWRGMVWYGVVWDGMVWFGVV